MKIFEICLHDLATIQVKVDNDSIEIIDIRDGWDESIDCYCTSEDYVYDKCIPYNDDTKHLVGTMKEAPEYYRYWED